MSEEIKETAANSPQTPDLVLPERHRQRTLAGQVHRVNGKKRPQAGIHRVTEAQHAPLAEQHVVRQADDEEITDLREHGQRQAAAKQHGRNDERQREEEAVRGDRPVADRHQNGGHLGPQCRP